MQNSKLYFIRVVEAGSFRKAASQLNVEASTVSRKIASLEKQLNVKLINRSQLRSFPTERGWMYYERLSTLIAEQTALDDEISEGVSHVTGTLRLAAPVDFGTRFVLPVCQKMQQLFPNLNMELMLGSEFSDLSENNLDIAVRIGHLPDSELIAQKVGQVARVLVASPDYLAQYGTPTTPAQLKAHKFVFYSSKQRKAVMQFSDGYQIAYKDLTTHFTINSITAIRQLVIAGAGIHLGPRWFFEEAINEGLVIPLLPKYPLQSFPAQCVYTSRYYSPIKVREFTRLLSEHLSEHLLSQVL